jgi:alpha-L-rhamnosidase
MSKRLSSILLLALCALAMPGPARSTAQGTGTNPELLNQRWPAKWIYPARWAPNEYGVYLFRKSVELAEKPSRFVVHASGDNRYQLFVNGARVAWGPARGDLFHWRYDSIDIAKQLVKGKNVLAAVVWNFGIHSPEAQVTNRTGFLLQGDTVRERAIDTGASWKCARNEGYQPIPFTHAEMRGYYVAGPGDRVAGAKYPWGWESPSFDDAAWPAASTDDRSNGSPRLIRDAGNRWMLVPRSIPFMEEKAERLQQLRLASGIKAPPKFPAEASPVKVPPKTKARLLLDQTWLTTAYPEIVVSGGRDAVVTLSYAEALYEQGARGGDKGDRNRIEGKVLIGNRDEFVAEGGEKRSYRPLWWRTYRYLQIQVETAEQELTIEDISGTSTGYPFERKAKLDVRSDFLDRVLEVGWRTARLCAHESYMDCPYYEQLQYAGDTRIQAMVSYFNAGDGRLARNAISQLDDSRTPEGATMSRAPTRQQQYIPGFSLWWIGMVHDYWRYQDDPDFVKSMLQGVRSVLGFFQSLQNADGSLGPVPWWDFVDWTTKWPSGVPPVGRDGSSAIHDLQLVLAFDWAAELEEGLGSKGRAAEYREAAAKLRETARRLYWDAGRGLFADSSDRNQWSQHSNALAVLAGVTSGEEARAVVRRTLEDATLIQCSYYFRHYVNSAIHRTGLGDLYLDQLGEWQKMLNRGLTTWAERPEEVRNPARSDCHAWSSSPNIELFRTVLGVESAAPGFRQVRIEPFPGRLAAVAGAVPHPRGEIKVSYRHDNGKIEAEVALPDGIEGEFVWKGRSTKLHPGSQKISF